jgi:hypothetical protein
MSQLTPYRFKWGPSMPQVFHYCSLWSTLRILQHKFSGLGNAKIMIVLRTADQQVLRFQYSGFRVSGVRRDWNESIP